MPREKSGIIIGIILVNCVELSKKNFGNYVVQHIIEKGTDNDKNDAIRSFLGKIPALSKHKISR